MYADVRTVYYLQKRLNGKNMEYTKDNELLKIHLGYVLKKKRGYLNDLKAFTGSREAERFINFGFVNTGHTLKYETWSATGLAKDYYIDTFGRLSYLKLLLFK